MGCKGRKSNKYLIRASECGRNSTRQLYKAPIPYSVSPTNSKKGIRKKTLSQVMKNTKDKVKFFFFFKNQKWDWRGATLTSAVTPFVVQVWLGRCGIRATQA